MRSWKLLALPVLATAMLSSAPTAPAQISVNIGVEPVCPYGYYNFAPYNCAPFGYYGPEWFNGGVFIGVGPWFHGRHNFYGHVNNRYDPHHGYHGAYPGHNEHFDHQRFEQHSHEFHGNEMRDGRGHVGGDHHGH
jgi:hypothetical protein